MADLAGGAARRRRERRLRSWLRHERVTMRMELAAALHHSAGPGTNDAVRSQKTASSRGVRPGVLQDPAPQLVSEHAACPCSSGVPSLSLPVLADREELDVLMRIPFRQLLTNVPWSEGQVLSRTGENGPMPERQRGERKRGKRRSSRRLLCTPFEVSDENDSFSAPVVDPGSGMCYAYAGILYSRCLPSVAVRPRCSASWPVWTTRPVTW